MGVGFAVGDGVDVTEIVAVGATVAVGAASLQAKIPTATSATPAIRRNCATCPDFQTQNLKVLE